MSETAVVVELWQAHDELAKVGTGSSAEVLYLVSGAADEAEALAACAGTGTPGTYEGLPRRWRRLEERVDETTWKVRVHYEAYERTPSTFTFDTGSGTEHVTQAVATIGSYAAAGYSAPDMKGMINFDGERVNGLDMQTPAFCFSETHYFDADDVDDEYKAALADLAKHVNTDTFRGFAAGEVLFLNAQGSCREGEKYEITFNFAVNRNATGITVGDITGIAKKGWEYMWTYYRDVPDVEIATGVTVTIKRPVACYVVQIYKTGAFSGLGLPS